jgi:hypothetical protein
MNDALHSNQKVQMDVKWAKFNWNYRGCQYLQTFIPNGKEGKNGYQPIPGRASNEASDSAATGGSSSIDPDHFEWTPAHLLSPNSVPPNFHVT